MDKKRLSEVLDVKHGLHFDEYTIDLILTELSALLDPKRMADIRNDPPVPAEETVGEHSVSIWHEAVVGGRRFKVSEDEDGFYAIWERVKPGIWAARKGDDYDVLAQSIVADSFWYP